MFTRFEGEIIDETRAEKFLLCCENSALLFFFILRVIFFECQFL